MIMLRLTQVWSTNHAVGYSVVTVRSMCQTRLYKCVSKHGSMSATHVFLGRTFTSSPQYPAQQNSWQSTGVALKSLVWPSNQAWKGCFCKLNVTLLYLDKLVLYLYKIGANVAHLNKITNASHASQTGHSRHQPDQNVQPHGNGNSRHMEMETAAEKCSLFTNIKQPAATTTITVSAG